MSFEPLDLKHQQIIGEKLDRLPTVLSEYFFPNCYLFRGSYGDQIHIGSYAAILTSTSNGEKVLTPLDPLTADSISYYKKLAHLPLYPIPNEWLTSIKEIPHEKRALAEDSDYLYTLDKMRHLPGRHLAKKRNLIHQFMKLYPDHSVKPLTLSTAEDAISVLEEWNKERGDGEVNDFEPCLEGLRSLTLMPLEGRLVYINDRPAGFTLGGMQQSAYVVLFMKALREFKGIYSFLYKDLALSLPDNVAWLNLGQDLGIPALMQAKKSYLPDRIDLKWRIVF